MALALERSLRQLSLRSSPATVCCRHISTSRSQLQNGRPRSSIMGFLGDEPTTSSPSSSQPTSAPRPSLSSTIDLLNSMNNSPPSSTRTSTPTSRSDAIANSIATIKENVVTPQLKRQREQQLRDLERTYTVADLDRQVTRRWESGDVYAPHDLSGVEAAKWKKSQRREVTPRWDAIDQLGLDPLSLYKNYMIMAEYTTQTGRIKPRSETGLRPKNQRRMAKAIRRAIGIGLIPGTYRHPQVAKALEGEKRPPIDI